MATIELTYFIYQNEEQLHSATTQIKLTKKDLKETEDFIVEHNYSPETVDIPGRVFDKCANQAFEAALKAFPEIADLGEEVGIDLEQYIPVSLLMQLSEETRQKMLTKEPYDQDESEFVPTSDKKPARQAKAETELQPEPLTSPAVPEEAPQQYEAPTRENTLYLTIKQIYFDEIIAGTKKEEYREIKPTTYKKYLACDEEGIPYSDPMLISMDDPLCGDLNAWNNGVYPFFPNEDYAFLRLAVGYHKERDEATVEIEDITFEPLTDKSGKPCRFHEDENGNCSPSDEGELCLWVAVFHLGKVVELQRKKG